jgi:TolA-binding protein
MKLTSFLFALAALGALLLPAPRLAFGQSKDILALQRDLYEVRKLVEDSAAAQANRITQLETLLRQTMESNAKLAGDVQALQEAVRRNQAEQEKRVFEPLAAVREGMDDVSGSVASMQASLNTVRARQEKMEGMLNDLSAAVRLLAAEIANRPAAEPGAASLSASDAASLLFAAAQRDKLAGKLDFALAGFIDIAQKYPQAPEAPMAVYEMGMLYAHNEQYADALKAFDRVLEQFGDNPMRKDAHFMKAEQLANLGRRADAAREYENFARQYSGDEKARIALARARELRAPAAVKATPPATKKGKR